MRSLSSRVAVVVLSVVLSAAAVAAPRAQPVQRGPVQTVRKIIKAFGDLLTVPTPVPTPPTKQP
jgi:hypothetical protein